MNSKLKEISDLFSGCLARYKHDQDPSSLVIMFELIKSGQISWKPIDKTALGFLSKAKYKSKCTKCSKEIIYNTDPVFYIGKISWCVDCSSPEDKKNSFYLKWAATNQVEDIV